MVMADTATAGSANGSTRPCGISWLRSSEMRKSRTTISMILRNGIPKIGKVIAVPTPLVFCGLSASRVVACHEAPEWEDTVHGDSSVERAELDL